MQLKTLSPQVTTVTQYNTPCQANAAGAQRLKSIPNLHGPYDKPQSSRRLLHWFVRVSDKYPSGGQLLQPRLSVHHLV